MHEINCNIKYEVSDVVRLTDETLITLYVYSETGTHENYHVGLQVSAGDDIWINVGSIKGNGVLNFNGVATEARAIIIEAEGSASTALVEIMVR